MCGLLHPAPEHPPPSPCRVERKSDPPADTSVRQNEQNTKSPTEGRTSTSTGWRGQGSPLVWTVVLVTLSGPVGWKMMSSATVHFLNRSCGRSPRWTADTRLAKPGWPLAQRPCLIFIFTLFFGFESYRKNIIRFTIHNTITIYNSSCSLA